MADTPRPEGPRPGAPVHVIAQAPRPVLTKDEARELFLLIEDYRRAVVLRATAETDHGDYLAFSEAHYLQCVHAWVNDRTGA